MDIESIRKRDEWERPAVREDWYQTVARPETDEPLARQSIAFDDKGSPCVGFWTSKDIMEPNSFYVHKHGHMPAARVTEWSFWPADMQLNRIPWPRGADGREL